MKVVVNQIWQDGVDAQRNSISTSYSNLIVGAVAAQGRGRLRDRDGRCRLGRGDRDALLQLQEWTIILQSTSLRAWRPRIFCVPIVED